MKMKKTILQRFLNTRKLKKELKEYKKDNQSMYNDIISQDENLEKLKGIINSQTLGLNQAYLNTRDMFMGPGEFILSNSHIVWKGVKITLGGEDITNKVGKIVISGPSFIEE